MTVDEYEIEIEDGIDVAPFDEADEDSTAAESEFALALSLTVALEIALEIALELALELAVDADDV